MQAKTNLYITFQSQQRRPKFWNYAATDASILIHVTVS